MPMMNEEREMESVVRCLKTVCDDKMLQEPSTTCSGAFRSRKFPVSVRTQLEIREGQRFNNFVKDLPAYERTIS
jgi:hypothetical protein